VLGLLDAGEVLIDDVRVIEDPDGEAIERMQNGSFQADAIGSAPVPGPALISAFPRITCSEVFSGRLSSTAAWY